MRSNWSATSRSIRSRSIRASSVLDLVPGLFLAFDPRSLGAFLAQAFELTSGPVEHRERARHVADFCRGASLPVMATSFSPAAMRVICPARRAQRTRRMALIGLISLCHAT